MQQEDCSRLQHEVLNRVRLRSRVAREDEMHDDQPRRRLPGLPSAVFDFSPPESQLGSEYIERTELLPLPGPPEVQEHRT